MRRGYPDAAFRFPLQYGRRAAFTPKTRRDPMKKTLLALAVIGTFCGAAQARADVTVYGSIDAGLRNQTNTDAAGDSLLSMGSNGTYRSNRLGFKGTEDLGGGLNAHFVLETGFK